MPATFPDVRLRQAGISAARIEQLRAAYATWPDWQQTQFRAFAASRTDEAIRRQYDPTAVPDTTQAGTGATGAQGPAGSNATVTDAAMAAAYGPATGAKVAADPLLKAAYVRPLGLLASSDPIYRQQASYSVMATPPTISAPSTTQTLPTWVSKTDASFRFIGTPAYVTSDGNWVVPEQPRKSDGTISGTDPGRYVGIEFMFDGSAMEVKALAFGTQFLFTVDGQLATTTVTDSGNTGDLRLMKVDFGSRAPRRIGIHVSLGYFAGLQIGASDTIWPVEAPPAPSIGFLHDSYGEGGGGVGHNFYGYTRQVGRLLGFRPFNHYSASGTGLTASSGAWGPYSTRVADVIANAPDVVLVPGSLNDYAAPAPTVGSAMSSVLTALKAGLPNSLIIASGIIDARNTSAQGTDTAQNAAIQSAATALGVPYIDTAGWIFGSGKFDQTAGDGNCDFYTYGDRTHPTAAGANYIARRLDAAIRAIIAQSWR